MAVIIGSHFSLFDFANREKNKALFTNQRHSLAVISDEIEKAVINGNAKARIFAGFQKMSFFLPQVKRYKRLANTAEHIWVFGFPDVSLPPIWNVTYIPLEKNDRLIHEWFVIARSPTYCSALIAEDLSGFAVPQAERLFRGVWTFNTNTITELDRYLCANIDIPEPTFQTTPSDASNQFDQVSQIAANLVSKLERNNAQLHQEQKLTRDLTDMVVHDLRNAVASVTSYLDLMNTAFERGDISRLEKFIKGAKGNGDALQNFLHDMLDISRLEAGELHLDQQAFPVQVLFDAIRLSFDGMAQATAKTLLISGDPALMVWGDPQILQRVMANLVGNAFRFTPKGGSIHIKAGQNTALGQLEISVEDHGPGIPKSQQTRIFEKFGQVKMKGYERQGFGLGLTFCHMAVTAHRGQITIQSEENQGTVFTVMLSPHRSTQSIYYEKE